MHSLKQNRWMIFSVSAALLSCYGVLALTSLLATAGITLSMNNNLWSATIVLCSLMATAIVVCKAVKLQAQLTGYLAGISFVLLLIAFTVFYHWLIELAGFIGLVAAAYLTHKNCLENR